MEDFGGRVLRRKADVIALANAVGDLIYTVRQPGEFAVIQKQRRTPSAGADPIAFSSTVNTPACALSSEAAGFAAKAAPRGKHQSAELVMLQQRTLFIF